MSVLDTVKEALQSPGSGKTGGSQSKGAYWCHDCSERVLDVDVEGDDPPACPSCDETMEFERSPDSAGCAC